MELQLGYFLQACFGQYDKICFVSKIEIFWFHVKIKSIIKFIKLSIETCLNNELREEQIYLRFIILKEERCGYKVVPVTLQV